MNWEIPKVYAVLHKNDDVRASSMSGGAFTAISDWVLQNNGIVYGCVLNDKFEAVHIRADNYESRNLMRGSKYVQSRLGDTFINVRKDLESGQMVLFSGTSCQAAGLKRYIGKEYENLLCVDIVCHGVPSPGVWKEYLNWQKKRNRSEIKASVFRNKREYGWHSHVETILFENGKKESSRIFTELFYGHAILRPCCYECPYKSTMHPGDITIADYWGIEKTAPELDDNKGTSLVLINNEKGEKVFDAVKSSVKRKQTELEDCIQPTMKAPFPKPEGRDEFWADFCRSGFDFIARKYCGYGIMIKIKKKLWGIKKSLKEIIRKTVK